MNRAATTSLARLAAPAVVVLVALVTGACGTSATATTTTMRPKAGPEAGVTSHYGSAVGQPGQPTTLAAEAVTRAFAVQVQDATAAFVSAVTALQADVDRGDVMTARADELDAQADYDAFRDLERGNSVNASTLDELDTDVAPGETFGGLHAVERDLWTGGSAATDASALGAQAPVAQYLLSHLRLGPEAVGSVAVDQLDWVVDDALPSSQEHTSHLGLVDVAATVNAADQAMGDLAPLGRLVAPGLTVTATADFAGLQAQVASLGPPRTTPDTSVSPTARLALSRQLDVTASTLARLDARLAPYGTAGAPS
jgi:iron uptake system EfeUOB component EfeO/EfeM